MDKENMAKRQEKVDGVNIVQLVVSTSEKKGIVLFGLGDDEQPHVWDVNTRTWRIYANENEK